ncbi:MAG TPA: aminotransferase class IV [Saprospiraceae bacterium]|jgi:branched-subunit amino acid aminotransferase/4-amino-4-deoxychorismate lyase|nr:aminotransferase class IV [Saprospiraceae bacterium]
MIRYHDVNGGLRQKYTASFRLDDLGLLRGYGIFDYFLVRQGVPMFWDDYADRFYRSARLLGLEVPIAPEELRQRIARLLEANRERNTAIRLLLTGGYADDSYTPTEPNLAIMQHAMPSVAPERYEEGIKLMLYRHLREVPEVKSTNYLTGIRIRELLKQAGAPEVLYHDGRLVSESARSNFFIVTAEGVLVTPAEQVLHGVTRKHVLELAQQAGIRTEVRDLTLDELPRAAEAFLTSTIKGVLPVVQIDELRIGEGRPGPVSRRLRELWQNHVADYIARHQPFKR